MGMSYAEILDLPIEVYDELVPMFKEYVDAQQK